MPTKYNNDSYRRRPTTSSLAADESDALRLARAIRASRGAFQRELNEAESSYDNSNVGLAIALADLLILGLTNKPALVRQLMYLISTVPLDERDYRRV